MENIQQQFISGILLAVIYNGKNYIKVTNNGPQWAAVQQGKYYLMGHSGKIQAPKKSKESLMNIFRGLINLYGAFEHNGKIYSRYKGNWQHTNIGFKWPVDIGG